MKKLLIFLLCALLVAGCAHKDTNAPDSAQNASTPSEATTAPPELWYLIYLPLENAEGLVAKTLNVSEITPESVLKELQNHNVLPEDVVINKLEVDGTQLNLDFNQAFADLVCSLGTSGEMMIVGSVVNTYLSAYQSLQVEDVFFTIDGNILESGHVIYDTPMGPIE